jgi:hypothetical protein
MNTTTTNTPGYNCRITISFSTDKNGRRRARYIAQGRYPFRSFPLSVDTAEILIATGGADLDGGAR